VSGSGALLFIGAHFWQKNCASWGSLSSPESGRRTAFGLVWGRFRRWRKFSGAGCSWPGRIRAHLAGEPLRSRSGLRVRAGSIGKNALVIGPACAARCSCPDPQAGNPRLVDDRNHAHGAFTYGTAERVGVPSLQDQVAPLLRGQSPGRGWGSPSSCPPRPSKPDPIRRSQVY